MFDDEFNNHIASLAMSGGVIEFCGLAMNARAAQRNVSRDEERTGARRGGEALRCSTDVGGDISDLHCTLQHWL